jgi:hypothetical protein
MKPELTELSRIICKPCKASDYEDCAHCRIHVLVNKLDC